MRHPRIAVVHDWLTANGGAERVLSHLLHMLPWADLYTLIDNGTCLSPEIRRRHSIKKSFLQRLPAVRHYYRITAPLMPRAVESLRLEQYDLVVSSSWAFAHGAIADKNAAHLAYIHSPMRWAWDMEDEYLDRSGLASPLKRAARHLIRRLRDWDQQASQRPQSLIANSQFVAKRIECCWGRQANVIYPPVALLAKNNVAITAQHGAYICVSRLVPFKRVDVWIDAFRYLPHRTLLVVGGGPEQKRLASRSGPNVHFLGFIPDRDLVGLLAGSRGFLQASKEDFGIAALEAQSCGTPVLAFADGGAQETIRTVAQGQPTGMLFHSFDPQEIAATIEKFEQHCFRPEDCRENALRFRPDIFYQQMREAIRRVGIDLPGPVQPLT